MNSDRYRLVLTTAASDDEARAVARALVEGRLAACVNIVGGVRSVYTWKGEVAEEDERLLLIKTEARLVEQVRRKIRDVHSYEVPEMIALPILEGDADYLRWLSDCVS